MKTKFATGIKLLFFLSLGFFFIWLFVSSLTPEQLDQVFESFRNAQYGWVVISVMIGIGSHTARAARWKLLLEAMGYKPRFLNVFFAVFTGYLANLALPRLGEVSRCGVLTRYEKIPFNKSFGTVITERAFDMAVFVFIFFITILIQFSQLKDYLYLRIVEPLFGRVYQPGNNNYITWAIAVLIVLVFVVLYLLRKRFYHLKMVEKLRELLLGFLDGMKSIVVMKTKLTFLFYTAIIWLSYYLMTYLVFFSFVETSHLSPMAGLAVLVFGSVGIIVVQGGIGVYQAIVAETLVLYGITSAIGYAMGWLLWSAQTLMIVLMGAFSMGVLPFYNRRIKSHEQV